MIKKRRFKKFRRIALVLVIFVVIVFGLSKIELPSFEKEENDVAAIVNGEVITKSEIIRLYDSLPPAYKAMTSPSAILNATIEEVLLVQDAEKEGIMVTDWEVRSAIQAHIISLGMIDTEFFEEYLPKKNISSGEFNRSVRNQLIIKRLLNMKIYNQIGISEKEIESYYDISDAKKQNISLEDVAARISYDIFNEKAAVAYELYISQLKKRADIKRFMK